MADTTAVETTAVETTAVETTTDTTKNEATDNLDLDDMKKIFVGKIPLDTKDEELKSFFENICGGTVTEHAVIRKENVKHYFGFFTFDSSHSVDEVIFKEKELIFNSATLEVNRAVPKKDHVSGPRLKTKTLFVSNIPETGFTEEELKAYFEEKHDAKYGSIESIQFIKKKDDEGNKLEQNKGFGFITVSSEHMADTMSIQHETFEFGGQKLKLKKSDRSGRGGQRGGRGGPRGGRGGGGGFQIGGPYGGGYGYGGYGDGYGQWDYYSAYGMYPQYGVSSAVRGGRGGTSSRGGRGGRGGGRGSRGGKRYTPYAKKP